MFRKTALAAINGMTFVDLRNRKRDFENTQRYVIDFALDVACSEHETQLSGSQTELQDMCVTCCAIGPILSRKPY